MSGKRENIKEKRMLPDNTVLGENIRQKRLEKNISQEYLAEQLNISRHGPVIIGLN